MSLSSVPKSRELLAHLECFCCGSNAVRIFYEVEQIPVHSVLLMPTREKAVGYPRGDLRLGFCASCGFIQNTAFDPGLHEYSERYEETQGFSDTFNRFARSLARDWIDRYGLQDKRILEIGCGKGEFLVLLCELGPNHGIGIDPSYVQERTKSEAASRIEFIRDFYSERHANLHADFICCRHTLEHIQPTRELLRTIRRTVSERPDVVLGFELPDVSRVLKEGAFWDLYYEHCSYFSLGSLARLFRASGFQVIRQKKAFDDQYLVLEARVGGGESIEARASEEPVSELAAEVEAFEASIAGVLSDWQKRVRGWHARGLRTAIWGSGSKAVAFLTTLGLDEEVGRVVDINPYRHGMYMPGTGHAIFSPEALKQFKPDVVIIMNRVYRDEIAASLSEMCLSPQLFAI